MLWTWRRNNYCELRYKNIVDLYELGFGLLMVLYSVPEDFLGKLSNQQFLKFRFSEKIFLEKFSHDVDDVKKLRILNAMIWLVDSSILSFQNCFWRHSMNKKFRRILKTDIDWKASRKILASYLHPTRNKFKSKLKNTDSSSILKKISLISRACIWQH